jgi:hypothetical protein
MIPIVPVPAPEPTRPPVSVRVPASSSDWADNPAEAWLWSVAFHGLVFVGLTLAAVGLRMAFESHLFDRILGPSLLTGVGGALALAGHRSLLYLSTKRLNADLAAQLRHPGTRT